MCANCAHPHSFEYGFGDGENRQRCRRFPVGPTMPVRQFPEGDEDELLSAETVKRHKIIGYWKGLKAAEARLAGQLSLRRFAYQGAEAGAIFSE